MKIVPTPYLGQSVVKNEWIDANGHMNVGHYLSAFDDGSCAMFDELGLGWDYTEEGKGTIFIMSSSLDYLQELLEGDELKISTWLITFDKRRVHIFQELFHTFFVEVTLGKHMHRHTLYKAHCFQGVDQFVHEF